MRTTNRLIAVSSLLLAAGCATLQDPIRADLSAPNPEVAQCAAWYRALDERVDKAAVGDAGGYRIPGFPYLRADRFAASFRSRALLDEEAFQAWMTQLRRLDDEARNAELRNLPEAALETLSVDRGQAAEKTRSCAAVLAANDLASPAQRKLLGERAQVPDDYLTWQRAVGLYAVTKVPFWSGIEDWHKQTVESFRKSKDGSLKLGTLARYVPPGDADRGRVRQILARVHADALGIPDLSREEREILLSVFAPVIEVETTGDYDRIGALSWGDGPAPAVDSSRVVVYRDLVFTRYRGETLVQLVYLAWFSERPHKNAWDMLAGRLDGIVWRVTLAADGEPLIYDSIHPCGCFHMFFPTARLQPVPPPEKMTEWVFIPADAPVLRDGARVAIRLATRTHYLVDVAVDAGAAGHYYALADSDDLRSILTADGGTRSAFGPTGLVRGSERGERVFFWPMGVPSAGAMRQWGHHATAFLGRRHFDDADLIDRRFLIVPR